MFLFALFLIVLIIIAMDDSAIVFFPFLFVGVLGYCEGTGTSFMQLFHSLFF